MTFKTFSFLILLTLILGCSTRRAKLNNKANGEIRNYYRENNREYYVKTLNLNYKFASTPEEVKALKCVKNNSAGTKIVGYIDRRPPYFVSKSKDTAKDNVFKCFNNNVYCNAYKNFSSFLNPQFFEVYLNISNDIFPVEFLKEYRDTFKIKQRILSLSQTQDTNQIQYLSYILSIFRNSTCCSDLPNADSINSFIKTHNSIRKLSIVFNDNAKLLSKEILHLVKGVNTIDTLILIESIDVEEFEFPTELLGELYESVKVLSIQSNNIKILPEEIFKSKKESLETLICLCDSIQNFNVFSKANTLKHLEIWDLKVNSSLTGIYEVGSLENLVIKQTNLNSIGNNILKLQNLKTLEIVNNRFLNNLTDSVICLPKLEKFVLYNYKTKKAKRYQVNIYKAVMKSKVNGCLKNWNFTYKPTKKFIFINKNNAPKI